LRSYWRSPPRGAPKFTVYGAGEAGAYGFARLRQAS
jgi:hypothetical protein